MKWKINSLGDNAVKEDISSRKYLATSFFLPFSHFSGSFVPSTLDSPWKVERKWQIDFPILFFYQKNDNGHEIVFPTDWPNREMLIQTYCFSTDVYVVKNFDQFTSDSGLKIKCAVKWLRSILFNQQGDLKLKII